VYSPEDDDAVEAEQNQTAGEPRQDSRKPRTPDPVTEVEDEEAEDDEDDADGLGERP
jgi:hypothetical protein